MELQDILVRIENTNSQDDSYDDLRCRLKDCANEIESLRAQLAAQPIPSQSADEPTAYYVYVEEASNGYYVDSLDDAQCVDDRTNADARVTPLYTKPQPTSQDVIIKTDNTQVILKLQEQLVAAELTIKTMREALQSVKEVKITQRYVGHGEFMGETIIQADIRLIKSAITTSTESLKGKL